MSIAATRPSPPPALVHAQFLARAIPRTRNSSHSLTVLRHRHGCRKLEETHWRAERQGVISQHCVRRRRPGVEASLVVAMVRGGERGRIGS